MVHPPKKDEVCCDGSLGIYSTLVPYACRLSSGVPSHTNAPSTRKGTRKGIRDEAGNNSTGSGTPDFDISRFVNFGRQNTNGGEDPSVS